MLKLTKFVFGATRVRPKARRRRQVSTRLGVELLESRVHPVVGGEVQAQLISPGSNLDGVVQIIRGTVADPTNRGSGSELANQTEILTANHVVPGGAIRAASSFLFRPLCFSPT